MRCKTCGSEIIGNADFCPNCGVTIHKPADMTEPVQRYVSPVQAVRPPAAGYSAPVKAKSPVRSRGRAGLRAMFSLTVMLLLVICSLGTVFFNILRLHYESNPETVYTGISYSMGFRHFFDSGFSGFFEDMDSITSFAMITVIVMLLAVLVLTALSAANACKKRFSAAAKLMGAGFMLPLVSYIVSFIDAIYIRSTYIDDGFPEDKCHLGAAPLVMMIFCTAAVLISFLAADSMENNNKK